MHIDKHVKLLLNSSIIIEGIVKKWDNQEVHILSMDGLSTSIITHPKEDIRVIKVIHQNEVIQPSPQEVASVLNSAKELEKKFEEVYNKPSDDELRIKNLAELRIEMVKQEKQILAEKLRNHHINNTVKVDYNPPSFFKKG